MQRGRRLAFDVGSARIGVAVCDPDGILATPLSYISRDDDDIANALALVAEYEAVAIYVGLPLNLEGKFTRSTFEALEFAYQLEDETTVRVRMLDERFSTKIAQSKMHEAGRNVKNSRKDIDSASAVEILERALEILKSGKEAGRTTDAVEQSHS